MVYDLLPGENPVATIDKDRLVLTNKRLSMVYGGNTKSIPLQEISFIETQTNYIPAILVIGFAVAAMFFFAIAGTNGRDVEAGLVAAAVTIIIFLLIYAAFPRKTLKVNSSGGSLVHIITGIKKNDVSRFIYLVEQERMKHIN